MKRKNNLSPVSASDANRRKRLQKRRFLLVLAAILLASISWGGYKLYMRQPGRGNNPIVAEINGKKYKVLNYGDQPPVESSPGIPDQIKALEEKVAGGAGSFDDYLGLAQLYESSGNTVKALEYYEIVKQKADKNMPYYDSFLQSINNTIERLKKVGQ